MLRLEDFKTLKKYYKDKLWEQNIIVRAMMLLLKKPEEGGLISLR